MAGGFLPSLCPSVSFPPKEINDWPSISFRFFFSGRILKAKVGVKMCLQATQTHEISAGKGQYYPVESRNLVNFSMLTLATNVCLPSAILLKRLVA